MGVSPHEALAHDRNLRHSASTGEGRGLPPSVPWEETSSEARAEVHGGPPDCYLHFLLPGIRRLCRDRQWLSAAISLDWRCLARFLCCDALNLHVAESRYFYLEFVYRTSLGQCTDPKEVRMSHSCLGLHPLMGF